MVNNLFRILSSYFLTFKIMSSANVQQPEFLICFEAWAKWAQQWLVCVPLGIHLEPINKEIMLLVITAPKRELCSAK